MLDMSGTIGSELEAVMAKAKKLQASGDVEGARTAYLKACELALRYANSAPTAAIKKQRLERAKALRAKADSVGKETVRDGEPKARKTSGDEDSEDADREQIRRLITRSSVSWKDIAGLDDVKEELVTSYAMAVARQPDGAKLTPNRNVLLYGPPGTGKTLLAAAVSTSLDATFFSITTGDLLSSLFGKSSQLVAAVFKEAASRAPSVLFFDEIDALVPSRDRDISAVDSRVVSAFLQAVDGFSGKSTPPFVFTIGATNKPWQLDNAMLSRFGRMVYVPLPDHACRKRVFELNLGDRGIKSELDAGTLADLAEGYSGREIAKVCELAVTAAIKTSNPDLTQRAGVGKAALGEYQLRLKTLVAEHFRDALGKIKPVTDAVKLKEYSNWAKNQGG